MNGILVAGIGNIFLGDDGFGVEVVRRLNELNLKHEIFDARVSIEDFGIRGIDLCYALLDGVDAAVLVDATARGGIPGTLYLIEPSLDDDTHLPSAALTPHEMDPARVLATVQILGGHCADLVVVGCEPADFGCENDEQGRIGLSAPVAAAVDHAVERVISIVQQKLDALGVAPRDATKEAL